MLVFALGLGLTAVMVATVANRSQSQRLDLGSMSHQWLAEYRASDRATSL